MLRMKLPQKKCKHRASDEEEEDEEERRPAGMRGPCEIQAGCLQREEVYEWFVQCLGPAQRMELACGLLDLCNPLELRFLGSCLEDLARKDCHYLRDCESRANGPSGEQLLGDLADPAARARLIVYLALLNSENREVAGRLYRLLLLPAAGLEEEDRDPGEAEAAREELLLLFTMASLHPAFSFHQRLTLRDRLEQLRETEYTSSRNQERIHEYMPSPENHVVENKKTTHNGITVTSHKLQREAVHIEKITFKGVQRKRSDKNAEYTFMVTWSDHSVTSVTKSHHELVEFILMLPKELSTDAFDKTILRALNLGSQKREERRYTDLEPIIRQLFSSPSQAMLQNPRVHKFFQASLESSHLHNNLVAAPKSCKTPELFKEDSSEASSQEEDIQQHVAHKKPAGKCPVAHTLGPKSCSLNRLHMPHCEQNGGTDWRNKNGPICLHYEHYRNSGHQRATDKCYSFPAGSESTSERNVEKIEGQSVCIVNGVKPTQIMKNSIVKEPILEVGSGHETGGETSSESYSSPSSPRHDRRESFESEEEKDRDTDSNSEDSTKNRVPSFTSFGTGNTSAAKLSAQLGIRNESLLDDSVNSKYPHIPFIHCLMQNGAEKLEAVISPTIPTAMKALGTPVSPVTMSHARETCHQCSLVVSPVPSAIGDSEKRVDLLASSQHGPSSFLPRNCQPSNSLHLPVHRLKMPSQGQSETSTVNGSTQTGLNLGSTNPGFIPIHSPGGFQASPVMVSDPISKPVSQIVGLNQVVPHLDGNAGAMPPSVNLKLVLPATNLSPAPPSVPYPLSGATLASGVLPTPNTNVLNAAVTAASSQPANVIMGQVQAGIPPAVPTHTPGPAPSPSPALTHSTAQSDSTSFISAAVGNTSTNGTLIPPQQMAPGTCGSCGRRCGCANSGVPPMGSYYYANHMPGQVYRVPPFFQLPSICNGTYLNQAHQSNGTQIPFFLQTPYTNGLMHDPVLGGQANYGMQQITNFPRFYPMYTAPNVVANSNASGPKKNGNVFCSNCGLAGHFAQECKQPSMDANQQGNRDSSQRTCF
ncbi:zinc finger CCHC domain-containing 2 isoform X1 [Pelobates cultripes]|uniref:Zinc finger CCHC domain-containing 2 isoform X1 n=1 Tax=Pelobates cultripes TaxID=61616 RepID=A0AAD1S148_PELCU|nr:zinc finger CCHC domain-containing 2 isoform X1 [Pelobates cultripes]